MGLPRTFVGFSSTDIGYFRLMLAWKANENIDFDFADLQLDKEVDSETEAYVKSKLRERITAAGTFLLLVGSDTKTKHKYVKWEIDVAVEKGCRLIVVNINKVNGLDSARCPTAIQNEGAVHVPFGVAPVRHAIEYYMASTSGNKYYSQFDNFK